MANLAPAANVGYAAVITTLVVAALQIAEANGIKIPENVMTDVPSAVAVLVAYFHDVYFQKKL